MSTVHFLNVGQGDCTLIEHLSGRHTLIDICKGNYQAPAKSLEEIMAEIYEGKLAAQAGVSGNFGMSKRPTNPIGYLKALGITDIFRFILTHPDMDHMDGLDALLNYAKPANFWDSGVRREKPDFASNAKYKEKDWDRYELLCSGSEEGVTVLPKLHDSFFQFANRDEANNPGADGLYILSPDKEIVEATNKGESVNDGSYVILYRSPGGRILIPGDAHDDTWAFVVKHHRKDVENCDVLFAPHHGRKSGADFSFLDIVRPRVTFFGCAAAGHLAYEQWRSRELQVITNNQAGNIVLESEAHGIDIFVENEKYARAFGSNCLKKNLQGYPQLGTLKKPQTVAV